MNFKSVLAGFFVGGSLMLGVFGSASASVPMSSVKLVEEKVIGSGVMKEANGRFINFERRWERRERRWERRERMERRERWHRGGGRERSHR